MRLHEKQRQAVYAAFANRVSVICGGPGTGKSLTVSVIVEAYHKLYPDKPIYLCAPTGRAAKRMSELSGYEAKTIHRLLAYNPELGFMVNEDQPLTPGLLIVDEVSMMDIRLAKALFSACPPDMRIVLVGDSDQLPSVGPGSVLRDIIESGAVPVTRLEYVYRQEEGSGISALAHQVNAGQTPELAAYPRDVVSHIVQTPEEALPLAVRYAKEAYEQYGLLGFGVLAPGHRGSAGVKALNEAIRAAINPGAGKGFSPGDKVMQIRNDYRHDVFNGDLGIIRAVEEDDGNTILTVDFGDKVVEYAYGEQGSEGYADPNDLHLAFASTIHKAQGGEFPVCIVVLTRQHWIMLQRNLLYTAITRAKKHLVIIYQPGAIERAVRNNKIAARNSRLAERLRGEK